MTRAKKLVAAAGIVGAMAFVPDAYAGHTRAVGHGTTVEQQAQQLTLSQEPEGRDSVVLGDMVESYRVESFRKQGDSFIDHPGRTENWKWGNTLMIFDYGCGTYVHRAWNEKDLKCPTGQNPPRALTVNNHLTNACPPEVRANRVGDQTQYVKNWSDDDFMKIYNNHTGQEIDNLSADSTIGIPGVGNVTEKMDRSYTSDLASKLGIDITKMQDVNVDRYQMDMLGKYLRSENDPYTITVVTQAEDAAGNPLCDVLAVTSYAVTYKGGPAAKGVPSEVHKTIAANLYLKENRAERTYLDTSVHGSPEIFAGEPAFDATGHLIFEYGKTNKYKIDASHDKTYMPFDELNQMWDQLNPYNTGARANLPGMPPTNP